MIDSWVNIPNLFWKKLLLINKRSIIDNTARIIIIGIIGISNPRKEPNDPLEIMKSLFLAFNDKESKKERKAKYVQIYATPAKNIKKIGVSNPK